MVSEDPRYYTFNPDRYGIGHGGLRWLDRWVTEETLSTAAVVWRLSHRYSDHSLQLINGATETPVFTVNRATNIVDFNNVPTVDGHPLLTEATGIDAATLDGIDSTGFVKTGVAANQTLAGTYSITGALQIGDAPVLSTADEGSLNAGTLAGLTPEGVRPAVRDDAVTIHNGPETLIFGGNMDVINNGDGTATVSVVDAAAVPDRTDISDGGTLVVSATQDINFATGFSVTNDGDNTVTVDSVSTSDTHITVADEDGTPTIADPTQLTAGAWLTVTDPGDGTARIDGFATSVEDDGGAIAETATLNFGTGLSASVGTGGRVDISATGADAATLDGLDSSQFLRSDVDDALEGDLSLDGAGTLVLQTGSIPGNMVATTAAGSGADEYVSVARISDANGMDTVNWERNATKQAAFSVRNTSDNRDLFNVYDGGGIDIPADEVLEARGYNFWFTPYRSGMQSLGGLGPELPYDWGMEFAADSFFAFVETDNDRVSGYVNTNTDSLHMGGDIVAGGGQTVTTFSETDSLRIHVGSTPPSNPSTNDLWIDTSA